MEAINMKDLREKYHGGKGITLEELAAKCTLSFSTVYKMEKGKACSRNSLKRVADVLKVSVEQLTGRANGA